jgi:enediyne biosynthesis protein E4
MACSRWSRLFVKNSTMLEVSRTAERVSHRRLVAVICRAMLAVSVLTCSACSRRVEPNPEPAASPIVMHDVTNATGIDFVHTDGSSGQRYIPETVTAGLATFDYDGDGLIDIYFLNGAPLQGATSSQAPKNSLWRNLGNWHFRDVTEEAGVGDIGFGLGVAAADYDNDGDQDLYVNNYGPNVLYRNEGDGTFSDVTEAAGVASGDWLGAGAAFLDVDADGLLDLYVANYVDFTYDNHVTHMNQGFAEYAGPRDYRPVPDVLYRNNGDGTFSDVSEEAGLRTHAGSGMGLVACDFDNDGDTDVFVLNDVSGNFLMVNDGKGHFEEAGLLSGTAYNMYGDELGSMGVDCEDYDNDGLLDFLMTSYQGELPVLYRNSGGGTFEDVTLVSGVGEGAYPYVNWGVGIVDFDNDGLRDAFIVNGHLQDEIDQYDDSTSYEVRNLLQRNLGGGKFESISDRCGDGLAPMRSSRGAAFDDLDNDGDIDAVVLNSRREPTIIRNDSPRIHHWIQIRLQGTACNRDAVGSKVIVAAGPLTQMAEVRSGRGYQGHFGTRLHFGLGVQDRIDRIEVHWLGGEVEIFEDIEIDRLVTLTQGSGSEQ